MLPIAQVAAAATLVLIGPAASVGTNAWLVFLLGALVLASWAVVAVHAYRVAARRHRALDVRPRAAGGLDLLWLAPVAVILSTVFWSSAARAADPGTVLADYVTAWRSGRIEAAMALLEAPPADGELIGDAWATQLSSLRNDLVRLSAVSGGSGIDPERPLDSVVWTAKPSQDSGSFVVAIEVVRRETVRGQVLGLVPSTSQRLVTLERLGTAQLRIVNLPGPLAGQAWRIVRVEVGGVVVGG